MTLILIALLATSGCRRDEAIRTQQQAFESARQAGDLPGLQGAADALHELGVLRKGMTDDSLRQLLGEPSTETRIYAPRGYSLGYGSADPQMNYDKFLWFHFERKDIVDYSDTPALVAWCYYAN